MKKKDAIAYFGNQTKLAQAVKISRQAVSQWPETLDPRWAVKIHWLSNQQLPVVEADYRQGIEGDYREV